jgi:hypothetical protein
MSLPIFHHEGDPQFSFQMRLGESQVCPKLMVKMKNHFLVENRTPDVYLVTNVHTMKLLLATAFQLYPVLMFTAIKA